MPRRSRIMLPDMPVHIVQRGNNRQQCFYEEQDRRFYLLHLARLLRPSGCVLHAYCLMTNHVHLLVTPLHQGSCARLMKHLGQLHTQYVNRNYGRSGTLWEGRFRSCLVQSEDYLLACYRYIESNPVRAQIANHPREYPWSSYRANAEGDLESLVTPHAEYLRLGKTDADRRGVYQGLFDLPPQDTRVEEIRAATNGNFALGDQVFQRKVSGLLGRRTQRGSPGRPARSSQTDAVQLNLLEPPKNVVCP